MKKYTAIILYSLVLVVFTAFAASGATLVAVGAKKLQQGETVTLTMDEYAQLQENAKLAQIKRALNDYFYDEVDEDALNEGAAYGMVAALGDPYSSYMSAEDMADMAETDSGEYVGIGGTFLMDPETGIMVITRIYPNSPLSETDAQVGDELFAVNGETVLGYDQTTIAGMIKGAEGKQVTITLQRNGVQTEYNMTLRVVEVVDVESKMLDDDILYINLMAFSTHADTAFNEALEMGRDAKMKALLIDLRNNGGGSSNILENIADPLLPEGLIFYTEDKQGNRSNTQSDARCLGLPIVVLCDGHSASASEVLIAALQDYEMATVVGTQTFGKAIGQSTMTINEDGSGLYITTVRVYSPEGRNWHGEGLAPDVTVELPSELVADPSLRNEENDLQLIEGLRILREQIQ